MCMHMVSGPSAGAETIAGLGRGDEIVLDAGFGSPAQDKVSTQIVVEVDGFSALLASGVVLRCNDGLGVTPTGNHFDEFEISPAAQTILAQVHGDPDLIETE